ncbi:MAG: NRDE family protein, partial [Rhodospirillales bacterium]|nr:NRDE family protein [Rhodospirillales bacterium]
MCTVIVLRRPEAPWPLLLAANRDEMEGRPWRPPARHWPDRHNVVAGLDELAGGTWAGTNDEGVVAAILNRAGTLGPEAGKRSRGELVLEALDHADAVDAVQALSQLNAAAYRAFNMVIADNRDAFFVAHRHEDQPIAV